MVGGLKIPSYPYFEAIRADVAKVTMVTFSTIELFNIFELDGVSELIEKVPTLTTILLDNCQRPDRVQALYRSKCRR